MCWKSRDIPGAGPSQGMCVCVCMTHSFREESTPRLQAGDQRVPRSFHSFRNSEVFPSTLSPQPSRAFRARAKGALKQAATLKQHLIPRRSIITALKPRECGEDVTPGSSIVAHEQLL